MSANIEACQKGKSVSEIQKTFDETIDFASERGFKQDAALAAQVAADFFLSKGLQEEANISLIRSYLQVALGHYQSWGAAALMNHIEDRIEGLESFVSNAWIRDHANNFEHVA